MLRPSSWHERPYDLAATIVFLALFGTILLDSSRILLANWSNAEAALRILGALAAFGALILSLAALVLFLALVITGLLVVKRILVQDIRGSLAVLTAIGLGWVLATLVGEDLAFKEMAGTVLAATFIALSLRPHASQTVLADSEE